MKKVITTILTALIMTLSFSSFADNKNNPLKNMEIEAIISTYIDATIIGKTDYNKYLYTHDFEYENAVNNAKVGRKEYLKFLNQNKGLTFNCKTDYNILDTNQKATIAKTTYTFENFTRIDHITLVKSNDGWKIKKIITSYL